MENIDFKNGDRVKYAGGLTFIFIGLNPTNNNEAYCIHPSATYQPYPNSREYKQISLLPINRLKLDMKS